MNYLIVILVIVIIIIIANYKKKESFINGGQFIPDQRISLIRNYFNQITPHQKFFLKNQCNIKEYNRFDIEPSMEEYIKKLIYPYIYSLNQRLNYNFIINKISNISEEKDENENRRYIIDFFMYENNNYFVSRVIIDLVIFNNNTRYLNKIVMANANLNKEKIDTQGIYGVDSNIVIKKQNVEKNSGKLDGIDLSTLEYSDINSDPYTSRDCLRSEVRNKWILPKGTPRECTFPCKKESNCWDKYGVLYSCDSNPKCIGVNTSATPKPFYPYYNPTITGTPANDNNYLDLMKLTRGWIKPLWQ
tara:strand:+ start:3443 stop:4351 length:909 start_codon:yes stop_codon:yes gene_type:complete